MELPRLPAATGTPPDAASGSRVGVAVGNVIAGKNSALSNVGSSPANAQTNANRAASAQVLAALLGRNAVTTLAQNPVTGSTIDARVDAALGDDLYLVTVSGSGQQLVARSAVTLTPQSVLSARVALVDGTVVLQRLDVSDSLRTDALAGVRAQLTAAGAVGQAVLDAFEQAGAPLDDARLAAAVDDLIELIDRSVEPRTPSGATPARTTGRSGSNATTATTTGQLAEAPPAASNSTVKSAVFVNPTSLPLRSTSTALPTSGAARASADSVSTVANASTAKLGPTIRDAADLLPRGTLRERADAHAALAARALPATPTLVALALRALDGHLPNLAATLPAAPEATAYSAAPATHNALPAAAERALPNAPALSTVPADAAQTGARATLIGTTSSVALNPTDRATVTAHPLITTVMPPPAGVAAHAASIITTTAVPAGDTPAAADRSAIAANAKSEPESAHGATATPERLPSAARANTTPITARSATTTTPNSTDVDHLDTTKPGVAAVNPGPPSTPPTRALVPDLRDGSAAVLRALALSGLRERGDTRIAEPTLLRVIASHSTSGLIAAAARATEPATAPHPANAERLTPAAPDAITIDQRSTTTATDSAREGLAHTLIRPKELAEYDTVLAVPLADHGQPLPARIAVTSRPAGNGPPATWVRVDTELSHLGAVSVRLSGLEGGPLAITIIAGERGVGPLADVLPELATALEQLGVQAAVRVALAEPA